MTAPNDIDVNDADPDGDGDVSRTAALAVCDARPRVNVCYFQQYVFYRVKLSFYNSLENHLTGCRSM